jgi:multisubunit Na+/H+ antiporter MnhC subunit
MMKQPKKAVHQHAIIYALIHGATYLLATWLLIHHLLSPPISIIAAIVPPVTFSIFIFKLIKAFSVMDEVNQRVQLEAVVIGFSLTAMLLMLLFLLSLCEISNPAWFGYAHLLGYCWLFYFVGWFVSRKKYGV